jgi:hypothetical protein
LDALSNSASSFERQLDFISSNSASADDALRRLSFLE